MRKSLGELPAEPLGKSERTKQQTVAASAIESVPASLQHLRHLEALVHGQSQVLEMISQGLPLAQILDAIARWVEAESRDEVLASLLLLDPEGQHLLHGAAPSLPQTYNDAIHGIQIGPAVGSCGTAAFTKRAVIVEDIAVDPLWADFRELALAHGLRACWSTPLIARTGNVLGTFAMYYRHPRLPTADDRHIIQLVTQTATLAIEHKQAEEERERLRVREQQAWRRAEAERQRLHDLFMEAPAAIALLRGPDHVFELANPLYRQAIGARRDVVGKPIRVILPELEGQGIYELLDRVYASGESYEGKEVLVKLNRFGDGALEDVYFNFVYQPTRDETGAVNGIQVHAVDVTVSVRARQLVEESEERYRTLFGAVPVAVYSCDANGVIQEYNQRAVELWGREPRRGDGNEQYCGACNIFYPDGRFMPHGECPMARVLRGETIEEHDAKILIERPDGVRRRVIAYPQILKNARGEIVGAVNCLYDVTERERAEAASAHLAAIVTSAEDAIASKTLQGIVTSWNASAERMFGYTAQEMIGQPILRLIPPDRYDEEDHILARIRAGEPIEHFETVRVTKHGQLIDVSLTISPVRDSAGTIIGASKIVRDITGRKQMEAAMRASEEKFRTLADNIPTLAWMARPDGHVVWYNHRWYEYTGTTPESQEGWGWQSVHDPAMLPQVLERWRHSLATGELFEMVFLLKGADGEFRPFLTRVLPLKDDEGRIVRWFGTNTDVSEQVRLQEALSAANQVKDEFLSIASHELRTPLTSAKINLQVITRRLDRMLTRPAPTATSPVAPGTRLIQAAQLEPLRALVERSEQSLTRLSGLVTDLLDVSRIHAGKLEMRPQRVDLVGVVREAVQEEAIAWPKREVRLQGELYAPAGNVWVSADPDRIRQVVINYLANALKYSPSGRPIDVRLEVLEATNGGVAPVARVSVRDQGPGLTPEQQAQLFERFYRVEGITHQHGSVLGLGLGLYISRTIVERHGGQVGVESVPAEGSTFWFTLPLQAAEPAEPES